MLRNFHNLDIFREVPQAVVDDYFSINPSASYGHGRSILHRTANSLLLLVTLFLVFSWYRAELRQEFVLDNDPKSVLEQHTFRVALNLTIHDMPCRDLSLDYHDVMGVREVDVRSTIIKQRLDKTGNFVGVLVNDPQTGDGNAEARNPHSVSAPNGTCGSCYGALPSPPECCNTCADVMYAYRMKRWQMPRIETVVQCHGEAGKQFQPPQLMKFSDFTSSAVSSEFPMKLTKKFDKDGAYPPLRMHFNSSSVISALTNWNEETLDTKWPECVRRNTVVHEFDDGDALFADVTLYGVTSGCAKDDCRRTDKFAMESMDDCARICAKISKCMWWSHGNEDAQVKCWMRTSRNVQSRSFQFSSGPRTCTPAGEPSGKSDGSSEHEARGTVAGTVPRVSTKTKNSSENDDFPTIPGGSSANSDNIPTKPDDSAKHDGGERRILSAVGRDIAVKPQVRKLQEPPSAETIVSNHQAAMKSFSFPFVPLFGVKDSTGTREQDGESCRISGYFDANKVPGNFHIGAHGPMAPSFFSVGHSKKPMRHTIHSLHFTESRDPREPPRGRNALENFTSPEAFTFQYYITVTPASYVDLWGYSTDQYEYTYGSFVTNELIGPAVYFKFDIDPIRVIYTQERIPLTTLLVSLLAALGGTVSLIKVVAQMMDA